MTSCRDREQWNLPILWRGCHILLTLDQRSGGVAGRTDDQRVKESAQKRVLALLEMTLDVMVGYQECDAKLVKPSNILRRFYRLSLMTTTISDVPEDVSRQSRASGTKEEQTPKFPHAAETKDLEKVGSEVSLLSRHCYIETANQLSRHRQTERVETSCKIYRVG